MAIGFAAALLFAVPAVADVGNGFIKILIPGGGAVVAEEGTPPEDLRAATANAALPALSEDEIRAQLQEAAEQMTFRVPFTDRGRAVDVEAVKSAVPKLLAADIRSQEMGLTMADRIAILRRTYTPRAVEQEIAESRELFGALPTSSGAGLPDYSIANGEAVIDSWHGVQVVGDRALGLAEGREQFTVRPAGVRVARPVRWQVAVERVGGAWRIERFMKVDHELEGTHPYTGTP